jgi:hypothetical protein
MASKNLRGRYGEVKRASAMRRPLEGLKVPRHGVLDHASISFCDLREVRETRSQKEWEV